MKNLLIGLALVTAASGYARAEGTEFKWGGEVRQRYTLTNNATFSEGSSFTDSNWLQRNKLHVTAITSDKLQAHFSLLQANVWGSNGFVGDAAYTASTTTTFPTGVPAARTAASTLGVHEAWVWWKVTDSFSLKTGRMSGTKGNGLIWSENDWQANPYHKDGLYGNMTWDFMDLGLGGGKLADSGAASAKTQWSNVGGTTTDSEVNYYALMLSFKELPDFLKNANVFALQINGDAGQGGGTFAPSVSAAGGSWGLTTYGLGLGGDVSMIDYGVDVAMQNGKQKSVLAGGTDTTFEGTMFNLEVGANFPEFMKGRFHIGYHMDSGNDSTTTDKNKAYQPLFYDMHKYAGNADIWGFGNLTDITVGLALTPMEATTVGLDYHMLTRTTEKAAATELSNGFSNRFMVPTGTFSAATPTTNTEKGLGTEIDLWAKHDYGSGFSMLANISLVSLGNYYKPTGYNGVNTSAYQFAAQAQYNF